jgi:hypothetical protein
VSLRNFRRLGDLLILSNNTRRRHDGGAMIREDRRSGIVAVIQLMRRGRTLS